MFKVFTSSDAHFQAVFAPFLYIVLVVGQVAVGQPKPKPSPSLKLKPTGLKGCH